MPFGLTNAPATFQRMMQQALSGLINDCCQVFIDDIVVYSKTFPRHLYDMHCVWTRLRENRIKLKGKKCDVVRLQVPFLGHIVTEQGIKVDPAKIEKVKAARAPSCKKELRQFLGLTGYYRRFVEGYVKMAGPLYEALKDREPGTRWTTIWTSECQKSFENLKDAMTKTPVLIFPDLEKRHYILYTDASQWGVGNVLCQIGPDLN